MRSRKARTVADSIWSHLAPIAAVMTLSGWAWMNERVFRDREARIVTVHTMIRPRSQTHRVVEYEGILRITGQRGVWLRWRPWRDLSLPGESFTREYFGIESVVCLRRWWNLALLNDILNMGSFGIRSILLLMRRRCRDLTSLNSMRRYKFFVRRLFFFTCLTPLASRFLFSRWQSSCSNQSIVCITRNSKSPTYTKPFSKVTWNYPFCDRLIPHEPSFHAERDILGCRTYRIVYNKFD